MIERYPQLLNLKSMMPGYLRKDFPHPGPNIFSLIKKRATLAITQCPNPARKRIGPHTLRHTTAMHLVQSGVDLTVIKNWLEHAHLTTTHAYVEINLDMKRKALSSRAPLTGMNYLQHLLKKNNDIICWLESL